MPTNDSGPQTTTYGYYPTGLLKQTTQPDGSYLQYTYDGAHRLTQITDTLGNKVVYTLDPMGNRVAENRYDPSGVLHYTHTRNFNALNELYQDVNAAGTSAVTTTFGYDNDGNQTTISAPLSRNTVEYYDALNRLKQITDPNGGNTNFSYDTEDDLLSVTDPRGLITSYRYNGFGDIVAQVSPDSGTTTKTYDSAGNLASSTDARGSMSSYTYNAANRVLQTTYQNGNTIDQQLNFSYSADRLISAYDGNQTTSWTYDMEGLVTAKTQQSVPADSAITLNYAYTNGHLTSMTTGSGRAVTYSYNSNGQAVSVAVNGTSVLSGATYEPFGTVNGWTWGNGTTMSRTYDTDEKISQISSAGIESYTYDNAFRITGITDTSTGAANWTYGYDPLDRLTSAATGSTSYGWSYDANGNRLSQTGTYPSTYSISPSANQITSVTGSVNRAGYSYDAAGNMLGYGTVSATYNNRGRMVTAADSGAGLSATYYYNSLGQQIQYTENGTVSLSMYDEAGHSTGIYTGSTGGLGTLGSETVWLGDIPVASLSRPTPSGQYIYYIQSDHLNTPHQVTRPADKAQMWSWFSAPFGDSTPNQNPQGMGTFIFQLRFPGQVSGTTIAWQIQNYNRDYDQQVGRYVESDPLGIAAGVNTYSYASGNPVGNADPRGLVTWRGTGTAIAAVYGGGASRMTFNLTSDCVNGHRAHVRVLAGGFAVGFGLTLTGGWGDLEFEDDNSDVDPFVFDGQAKFVTAGVTIGGVPPKEIRDIPGRIPSPYEGLSIQFSALQLGGATSIGLGQMLGIDASISGGVGISMVQDVKKECCSQ
jgi:RHS repeat-associated protein